MPYFFISGSPIKNTILAEVNSVLLIPAELPEYFSHCGLNTPILYCAMTLSLLFTSKPPTLRPEALPEPIPVRCVLI